MTCPRIGKLFGACKWSARYDFGEPISGWKGSAGAVIAAMEVSKPKTYVRDVCERCGKTAERTNG
jgi:hypothetical protein